MGALARKSSCRLTMLSSSSTTTKTTPTTLWMVTALVWFWRTTTLAALVTPPHSVGRRTRSDLFPGLGKESRPVKVFPWSLYETSKDDWEEEEDDDELDIEEEEELSLPDERGSYDPRKRQEDMTESEMAAAVNELAKLSVELPDEISSSFLQYALSIILGRALPDVRDGLKPVHRRILYAMNELRLGPSSSHRKCARVVGEVLGKFHPHGDVAVYDALVRMAQDFSTGTPLVDGHGNFGSIDADPPAAMRYTECRLTTVAQEALLADLDLDTIDFVPNFDGNEMEPTVLPAKLPILLLNGCAGIAVGMATHVPPHNLGELMTACRALTAARDSLQHLSDEELFQMVPGPDFPTGATMMGTAGSRDLYLTGNGGVVLRAVTHLEQGAKKGTGAAIIVTELPFQVNKAALLEKIANLVNDKKLDGIADLRDESDRDGIRIVIQLKRDAVAAVVLNNLLKKTPLQTTFSGNFLALMGSGTVPQRFTLRSALDHFLDFRFQTLRRRSAFQLGKVTARAHVVDGLLIALDSSDELMKVVRGTPNQASARSALMSESGGFTLSAEQADAVLRLQLGQLNRLNRDKLGEEKKSLKKDQEELNRLMTDDSAVRQVMMTEFDEMARKFATPRRTVILQEEGELRDIDLVRNARSVIVVTRGGYIKRMPLQTFESQNRGTRGKRGTFSSGSLSEEDTNDVSHCFTCNDHDTLLMTTQRGVAYGVRAFEVPTGSRTARGVPIPSVLPVKADDAITSILPVSEFSEDEYCVLATERGWIKKTPLAAFEDLTSRGLIIATLQEGDQLCWCQRCYEGDDILIGSVLGMAARFQSKDLRPTGRRSRGVKAMKLRNGDCIADVNILRHEQDDDDKDDTAAPQEYVLSVTSHGYGKRIKRSDFSCLQRGRVGVLAIKFRTSRAAKEEEEEGTTTTNDDDDASLERLRCLRVVHPEDEILLITAKGIIVRQRVKDIPIQGRRATGVLVQKVDVEGGDCISSVSIVPKRVEEEEEEEDDDDDEEEEEDEEEDGDKKDAASQGTRRTTSEVVKR